MTPNLNDLFECLDAAKITDILLCLYNANEETKIDQLKQSTESVLNAVYHHCLPTCLHVVYGLNELPVKKHSNLKKSFQKQLNSMFPDEKLHYLDNKQDALQLLNTIGNCKKKQSAYRERRSQLLADKLEYVDQTDTGILRVYGYVRNKNLDVNKLIHIPGCGDFKLGKIEVLEDPYKTNKNKLNDGEMHENCIYVRDPLVATELEDIKSHLSEDEFDYEQELPTAEDIAKAEEEQLKIKKLVPKGTSDYQAAWLVDSDEDCEMGSDENSSIDDDSDMENQFNNDEESIKNEMQEDEDYEDNDDNDDDDMQSLATEQDNYENKYDEKMDLNEEMKTLNKIKEEKLNEQYPDEIDTPLNVAAKLRFAKYRGLASFHKTKWATNENLPKDYSNIYEFQNLKRTTNASYQSQDLVDGPSSGEYVMVEILDFNKEIYEKEYVEQKKPLLFYQLLKHEHRMTLMNVVIKKHPLFTKPIKSKERLIFHVGCRRYSVCPIFSLHSNGNKHKYEKFLRSDTQMVASFYAPTTFTPCSVTVYKQFGDGSQHLVATGSVLNANPSRVIVKRLILSGYPFKIHKTFCVIRYMFFNRDDILWFKPIELRTKYGRKGSIKEPLGTHGHMKCVFDRPIKSNDTVLMNLYKRVFPKWNYEPNLNSFKSINKNSIDDEIDLKMDKKVTFKEE